jgi:hypothetical protein
MAAALISLANLLVTTLVASRQAETAWTRNALTDVVTAFLDASWAHTDEVRRGRIQAQSAATDHRSYDDLRRQLTRLRILASRPLRDAGVELVDRHRRLRDRPPGEADAALRAITESRHDVIREAKRELRLR